jgi:hypothetical protein
MNLAYSMFHGRDLELRLTAHQPDWVIIEYPNRVSAASFELLRKAGFEQEERFKGWVDWTNGDVVVMKRSRISGH